MNREVPFQPEARCADSKHCGECFVSAYGSAIEGALASDAERFCERERPTGRYGSPKRHASRRTGS